jgi:hypothetical protein
VTNSGLLARHRAELKAALLTVSPHGDDRNDLQHRVDLQIGHRHGAKRSK